MSLPFAWADAVAVQYSSAPMRLNRRTALALAATAALAVAGCSEESSEDSAKPDEEAPAADVSPQPKAAADAKEKPKVTVPKGAPPKKLEIEDIEKGKGATAKAGSSVSVNYVGVSYSNGKEFDSSFGKQPFQFQLGASMVIPGWEEGVEGMKVGGRRQLIVPPDKAYGAQGSPPAIGSDETLLFVIDLLQVQ